MQKQDQPKKQPLNQVSKSQKQSVLSQDNLPDLEISSKANISKDLKTDPTNMSNSFSLYDAQSSFYQNMNASQNKSGNNNSYLPKEYFNCAFFTRKMSSKSSDMDFGGKEPNDFFKFRLGSNFSKDSYPANFQNIYHKPDEELSLDLDIEKENISAKIDDPSNMLLQRAKSAVEPKKNLCNFVLKSSYFDKKNNGQIQENKHFVSNKDNLLLKYYSINPDQGKNKNQNLKKLLDDVNERDDDEDEDENSDDDKLSVKEKNDDEFILQKNKTNAFKLVHRISQDILPFHNSPEIPKKKDHKKELSRLNTLPVKTKINSCFNCPSDENNSEDEENKSEEKSEQENYFQKENKVDNNLLNDDFNKNNYNFDGNNFNSNEFNNMNFVNNNSNLLSNLFNLNNNVMNDNNVNNVNNNNENSNKKNNFVLNSNQIPNNNQFLINNNIQNNTPNNNINVQGINIDQNNNTNNLINNNFNQNMQINQFMNMNNNNQQNNFYSLDENKLINEMNNMQINNSINNDNSMTNYTNNSQNNNKVYNFNNIDLNDLLNNISDYIKNQAGCRFIQKEIEENPSISNTIFDSLYYDLYSMCGDLFGNYVVQKLLETIDAQHLFKFMKLISKDFSKLAISNYGTRVVQKLLEIVSSVNVKDSEEIYQKCFKSINYHITNDLVSLSSNNNSSHIIIKYVNEIKYPRNVELFEEVYRNFIPLCKDKYGCCVIQKCIDSGNEEQKNKLLELSCLHCNELISDQFGNYVIQFVVCLNLKIVNQKVYEILKSNLCSLCKEKYASNVIEKFLIKKSDESKEIINLLLNDEKTIHEMIIDKFGNYIIQRILGLIDGEDRSNLIKKIVIFYPEIKNLPFGPRIISKLHERYREFTMLVTKCYGWKTYQETLPYCHLNNKNNIPNMNNNNQFNPMFKNGNNNPNLFMGNNMNENILTNQVNNNNQEFNNYQMAPNNCMNFRKNSNIGNINFIQMNNYMIPNNNNPNNNQNVYNANINQMKKFGTMNQNNNNNVNNLFYQQSQMQKPQNIYGMDMENQMMNNNNVYNQGNDLENNNMRLNYLMNNQNQLNYQQLMAMNSNNYQNM